MRAAPASIRVPRALPAVLVHVSLVVVTTALSLAIVPVAFWLVVAIALGIAAGAVPRLYTAWALIILLPLFQLPRDPSTIDWRPYALLAGLHLIHNLASLALVVPVRGMIDARVFVRPLCRFVIVQLPCQALLALLLVAVSSEWFSRAIPWLAPVGAAALIVLAGILIIPLARHRGRSGSLSHR